MMVTAERTEIQDPVTNTLRGMGEDRLADALEEFERTLGKLGFALDPSVTVKRKGGLVKLSLGIEPLAPQQLSLLGGG